MKFLNTTIFVIALILSACSIFYFGCSLYLLKDQDSFTVQVFYNIVAIYSGLYKSTFVVWALFLTLRQLHLASETSKGTLDQIRFTQEDILAKRKKEIVTDTLIHCKYYFTEIQNSLKQLTVLGALDGMPIKWYFLKSIDNESLREHDDAFKVVIKNTDTNKMEILLTLYKIEAFSALFVRGNLDLILGKEIIGHIFCGQMDLWLGIIASFRENEKSSFCKDLLELYNKWKS